MQTSNIFSPKDFERLKSEIDVFAQGIKDLEKRRALLVDWQQKHLKAKQLGENAAGKDFLRDLFEQILGYAGSSQRWQFQVEYVLPTGARPDAILGYFGLEKTPDIRTVVELKGIGIDLDTPQSTKNVRRTPVEQGFSYAKEIGEACRWVIVSNFEEIRLYNAGDTRHYETFFLASLHEEPYFSRFLYLCGKDQLFFEKDQAQAQSDSYLAPLEQLYTGRLTNLERVTNRFYKAYSENRKAFFWHLHKKNPKVPVDKLITATQKIMDRLIFMRFVNELGILHRNVLQKLYDSAVDAIYYETNRHWQHVKNAFRAFDEGYKKDIPPFNGGLFAPDAVIQQLDAEDEFFTPVLDFILDYNYDFKNDLKVDILGHIFENSLTDLEELKQQVGILEGGTDNAQRKKDGVFYTPEYVTQYMVEHSVGAWLRDREAEILQDLGIYKFVNQLTTPEQDLAYLNEKRPNLPVSLAEVRDLHLQFWERYKACLQTLKVLDPACGSGAFLLAVFDFLVEKWRVLNRNLAYLQNLPTEKPEKEAKKAGKKPVTKKAMTALFESEQALQEQALKAEAVLKKEILKNNLYGVDVNMEAISITKLALWLKTAHRTEKLVNLSENIRQGNSLVSDAKLDTIAFDWKTVFPFAFDVIVGNPPYVRADNPSMAQARQNIVNSRAFTTLYEKWDLYVPFFERAHQCVKLSGYVSFIVPDAYMTSKYAQKSHEFLLEHTSIRQVDFCSELKLFEAGVRNIILCYQKGKNPQNVPLKLKHEGKFGNTVVLPTKPQGEMGEYTFRLLSENPITADLSNTVAWGEICYVSKGMVLQADEKKYPNEFVKDDLISEIKDATHSKPYIEGKWLKDYEIEKIKYLEWGTDRVPAKVSRPTFPQLYPIPKIMQGGMTGAIYDESGLLCNHGVTICVLWRDLQGVDNLSINNSIRKDFEVQTGKEAMLAYRQGLETRSQAFDLRYLLAILNSAFGKAYLQSVRRSQVGFYPDDLKQLPIKQISLSAQQPFVERVQALSSPTIEKQARQQLVAELNEMVQALYKL